MSGLKAGAGADGLGGEVAPKRTMITVALLLAMVVTAVEQTVVSTAMPSIISQFKGVDIYPWVFSAYLLAATVTTPIYGKLADIVGRKRVLLFGLGLFCAGSMLSGLSRSMSELIAMRVVQGLGAGAVAPIVLTLLGDLFSLEERAKVQGLFSGVWGVSSLAGPLLGGWLTDELSWRWVFFATVPFGVVSAAILTVAVREKVVRAERLPLDWPGSILLATGSLALLLAVLEGASRPAAWGVGFGLAGVLLVAGFVWWERFRAADPMLPMDLLARPAIAASIAGSFLIGVLLFGLDTYIPLYVQGVLGGKATAAGMMITPLFLAWSISVAVAAKLVVRYGFRATATVGSILIAAGSLLIAVGAEDRGRAVGYFVVGMAAIGVGMGPTSLSYILGVQNAVEWNRRGVATGAVTFFRTIGGALGVGFLGAVLGWELGHRLASLQARGLDVAAALRPETHDKLAPEHLAAVQLALGRSLRDVFLQMFVLALAAIACSLRLAPGRPTPKPSGAAPDEAELVAMIEH